MKRDFRVFVYSDYPSDSLNIEKVINKISEFEWSLEDRGNIIEFLSLSEQSLNKLAQNISSSEIPDISNPHDTIQTSSATEIQAEINKLLGRDNVRGKFYDGYWVQRVLYSELAAKIPSEIKPGFIHLIFTGRLFGTFQDRRYHARVVLMGTPSIISTSGLVEAPAKPREYYYVKGKLIQSGMGLEELDKMYKGRFVEYDDPKISDIIPSYALQAISYELTGKEFCENTECCLSNSHWQEEVLKVQYKGNTCKNCSELLRIE